MPPFIKPKQPLRDMLPQPIQKALDLILPADDIMGPAMPGTAVVGPAKSLVHALKPLAGSLQKGQALANELMKRTHVPPPEPLPIHADPAVKEMWHLLRKLPDEVNLDKMALSERVTASKPSKTTGPALPDNWTLRRDGRPHIVQEAYNFARQGRDPQLVDMRALWNRFQRAQPHKTTVAPQSSHQPGPPRLSGKWNFQHKNKKKS